MRIQGEAMAAISLFKKISLYRGFFGLSCRDWPYSASCKKRPRCRSHVLTSLLHLPGAGTDRAAPTPLRCKKIHHPSGGVSVFLPGRPSALGGGFEFHVYQTSSPCPPPHFVVVDQCAPWQLELKSISILRGGAVPLPQGSKRWRAARQPMRTPWSRIPPPRQRR
jgi:hypothetical protein